ncbi:carboxyl transferase domain-containing protein [Williamsia sterculiae]|uniref:Acetyl-CoA carboxylase carboxyl transferase subunit beta n=1 Tax=Williamsia sterculiae TaxID=1344003 RepID=A0A1N7DFJ8_9NOCA|nr:carboxyl transferase domain-containing protein [Williamsia sterculiae]SIR74606.1 acetyl-CoA carboxylase carboxyl transferase subunit beta [Williamsia sterculiae]
MVGHPDACELIDLVVDQGSWESWDSGVDYGSDPDGDYAAALQRARERAGVDESVITGRGVVDGTPVALLVSEFGFLAGSIGVASGRRVVAAVRRATAEGLALLAFPASGGTRMQEGTRAFLQMADIAAAVTAHKAAHLPYLVYLRHPTTGGVFASWGSLGQLTLAEPDALIGFLGPRVYEGLYGRPFPGGVQCAQNLRDHGWVDLVVAPADLRTDLRRILHCLRPPDPPTVALPSEPVESAELDAWVSVQATRADDRPGVRDLLAELDDVVMLDGAGERDYRGAVVLALARCGGRAVVVVGQDRATQRRGSALGPDGLRMARRGMRLAAELDVAVVTVIDTPGADLSAEAENGGLAAEIANCLATMMSSPVPTVSVLLGEGTGGAALALLPADRVIAAEHSWLAPLPPEGASVIVHRDTTHAADMARDQGIGVVDLHRTGVVDQVIGEEAAGDDPSVFCRRVGDAVGVALAQVADIPVATLAVRRAARMDGVGRGET